MKKGINFESGEPNYDLYQLALETTAKRLFPNFSFIDSTFNLPYYNGTPESEVAYMGCRTRVMGNCHGDENSFRRGNLSFTSINLVKLALISKNIDDFFVKLDRYINLCCKQLLERFEFQGKKNVRNFPFLYGQHIWKDSELLGPDDEVKDILKHGSLAVGFIGLAEALVALTGKHHGESDESYQLGYKIVEHM